MCVLHWGPSEHLCKQRPKITPGGNGGCDRALEAAKLLKLWKTAYKTQTGAGAVAEKPWQCNSAADLVDVRDRWQATTLKELDFTNVTVVRNTAIQLIFL